MLDALSINAAIAVQLFDLQHVSYLWTFFGIGW
jgi:hypothetical protein